VYSKPILAFEDQGRHQAQVTSRIPYFPAIIDVFEKPGNQF
jgi:hypothetical protein